MQEQIVQKLLEFGEQTHKSQTSDSTNLFSKNDKADELCHKDPLAFVLACLAAGGMRAEKIWEFPYKLQERFGNLNTLYKCEGSKVMFERLVQAIEDKPALHRFPYPMAKFIQYLTTSGLRKYNGDASNIWSSLDAKTIQENFLVLKGFGPKKAAMATELLHSFLGLQIKNLQEGNVAADVHVIRVLNRLELISDTSQMAAMKKAREMYPSEPGKLDFPLWKIGKTYCKARTPNHKDCPLNSVCPKVTNISL